MTNEPAHGTYAGYMAHKKARDEKCGPCKAAAALYERWRGYDHALGRQRMVDATGTVRRIRALHALGYSRLDLATRLGMFENNLPRIGRSGVVYRVVAEKVTALYDELSMIPGPSARAVAHAARKGWVPPLAWDDDSIDDPAARPYVAPRRGLRDGWDEARWADVEHLRGFGYTDDQIAARLGIEPDSLRKAIARAAA